MLADLTPQETEALLYEWRFWARPITHLKEEKGKPVYGGQIAPPGDWRVWLIIAGRGYGKTRVGAEWVKDKVKSGQAGRIGLVAETAADARDVMVEGESGILSVSPPWFRPKYEPSKRRLTWPNGAIATTYSADDPEQLRGPQHDAAWADEPGKWRYPDAWDQLMFGLRLGDNPQAVATTTPRPIKLIRALLADPTVAVTRGSTFENAGNLAPAFLKDILKKYKGTRLGRQELYAELLDDVPGALWKRSYFQTRVLPTDQIRVAVGIDPAATSMEGANETGIIVSAKQLDDTFDVLADRSGRYTPDGWAKAAISAFDEFMADCLVAEVNNGGEMVEAVIRAACTALGRPMIPFHAVHASRGKAVRAEPIATVYEQMRVFHAEGLEHLEDQLCVWTPDSGKSPDRLDALVWVLTFLSDMQTFDAVSSEVREALQGYRGI